MGTYANISRGPVVVTLRDGTSVVLRPRAQLKLTVEQDGSGDLIAKVRKGMLKRMDPPVAPMQETTVNVATARLRPAEVPQSLVSPSHREVAEEPSSSVESPTVTESSEETSRDEERRNRRRDKYRS